MAGHFQNVITHGEDGDVNHFYLVPVFRQRVRKLEPNMDPEELIPGWGREPLHFAVTKNAQGLPQRESLAWESRPLSQQILVSKQRRARLFLHQDRDTYMAMAFEGDRRSALYALYLALPRMPMEIKPSLMWKESLPRQNLSHRPGRILADMALLVWPRKAHAIHCYRCRREGKDLVVEGRSCGKSPAVSTLVRISPGKGILEISITREHVRTMHVKRRKGKETGRAGLMKACAA